MPAALSPERLAVVAALADARVDADSTACLLRVRLVDDEVELGWLPTDDGAHPLDALVGATAPADWRAVGVHASGRARAVDDDTDADRSGAVAVRTTLLVGRDGGWAYRWSATSSADVVTGCGHDGDAGQPAGRIDDACRRALGLPTAPPEFGTGVLWATLWLDAVVERAGHAGGRRSLWAWPEVAALHPAVAALLTSPTARDLAPAAVGRQARRLASWRDWPAVRRASAAGADACPVLAPEVAAWLDDGAFSRWVLGAYPDLADLRAAATDLLPARVGDAIEATITASDLAGTSP